LDSVKLDVDRVLRICDQGQTFTCISRTCCLWTSWLIDRIPRQVLHNVFMQSISNLIIELFADFDIYKLTKKW